jgi:RNA polymerase-associated protein RTF1
MSSDGFVLPSKAFLAKKSYDIGNLLHRSWTEAELQEKLRRSGVLKQKFSSLERAETLARLEEARSNKNEERIVELEVKLKALDGPKLAFGTSLVKKSDKPTEKTQQQRLGELNAINRKLNIQNVRRAQLAERKDEAKKRAAIERGEATANPFARVKTYAKTHHKVEDLLTVPGQKKEHDPLFDGSDNSRQATPMSGVETPKVQNASPAPVKLVTPIKSGKSGVYSRRPHDDEVLASIDIELDIDVF